MNINPQDEVSDSDDEWYRRMEAEGAKYTDDVEVPAERAELAAASSTQQTCTEDDYFAQVQKRNCEECEEGFASEVDPIWHSMLQSVAKSTNKTGTDGLVQLKQADSSSLILLQQWAASYLPKSCKQLMEIVLFSSCADDNRMLFTDDVLHPSIVCIMYVKPLAQRVEVSLFSPYCQHELNFHALLSTVHRIQRAAGLNDVVYCGTDGALYETGIVPQGRGRWSAQWVENCGQYVNEEVLSGTAISQQVSLPEGYAVCDLRPEHAQQINDSWKYKSATSLDLVRTMIEAQLCSGIAHHSAGAEESGRLVGWFLTYPDSSMGMLYTLQEHRGKGLARAVVLAVLDKCAQRHKQESRKCAPYVYIESSNDASKALFTSLGFTKCNDVVWAGLKLDAES